MITVRVECMVGVKTRESYQQAREEVQRSNNGKDKTPNNQLKTATENCCYAAMMPGPTPRSQHHWDTAQGNTQFNATMIVYPPARLPSLFEL